MSFVNTTSGILLIGQFLTDFLPKQTQEPEEKSESCTLTPALKYRSPSKLTFSSVFSKCIWRFVSPIFKVLRLLETLSINPIASGETSG